MMIQEKDMLPQDLTKFVLNVNFHLANINIGKS